MMAKNKKRIRKKKRNKRSGQSKSSNVVMPSIEYYSMPFMKIGDENLDKIKSLYLHDALQLHVSYWGE